MKLANKEKDSLLAKLKYFLWWCAGADVETLKRCPSDHAKFTAVGMMMCVVPFLAAVSFNFFLQQSFNADGFKVVLGSIAWGSLIFILDRLILTFHRKGKNEILRALPRIVLSVCLALVISEPMLLHFFKTEIELELLRKGQFVRTESREKAEARFRIEKEALQKANEELQTKLDGLKRVRDEKESAVINEIEGTVGTRIKGDGPAARQKQRAFDEAKAEYERARTELLPQIEANKKRLDQIQTDVETEVKSISDAQSGAKGVLARHSALFSVMRQEPSTAFTYIPLFIILLMLEISPLIIKLSADEGEYDKRLTLNETNGITRAESEMKFEGENEERLLQVENGVGKRIANAVEHQMFDTLDAKETEVARLLQTIMLERFRKEVLTKSISQNGNKKFGKEITIEVVDRPDLRISLQLPGEARSSITLAELDSDLQQISEEITEDDAQLLELVRATNSSGCEVHRALPLLPQLGNDQKLLLKFAPVDLSKLNPN